MPPEIYLKVYFLKKYDTNLKERVNLIVQMQQKHTYILMGLLLGPIISSCCKAEQRIALNDDSLNLSFYAGVLESSHLGIFENYLFNNGNGITSGNTSSSWEQYFPNGLLPKNTTTDFVPQLGFEFGAELESDNFPAMLNVPSRISAFYMQDSNQLNIFSPNGLGIFIDPTEIELQTSLSGWGAQYQLAMYSLMTNRAEHDLYGGIGFFRYKSLSSAKINSAFLDVTIHDEQTNVKPIFSLEYRYKPIHEKNSKTKIGIITPNFGVLNLKIFPTDHFVTVTTSTSISFEF
jgi:hypothetical protein